MSARRYEHPGRRPRSGALRQAILMACACLLCAPAYGQGSDRIPEQQAKEIAAKAVEGEVMDVQIERKFGADRYVVEVIRKSDGAEVDVIIDMKTGEVLATEN